MQIINRIGFYYASPWKRLVINALFFLVLILPPLIIGISEYKQIYSNLTNLSLAERLNITYLAAQNLESKFDTIIKIGVSHLADPDIKQLLPRDQFKSALEELLPMISGTDFIDSFALFDARGVLRATYPDLPEAIGRDFSHRDYYKGVMATKKPYVSEIFIRAVEPKYQVVSIALPINTDDSGEMAGFLLFTVRLRTFVEWSKDLHIGNSGFIYFVDKKGNVAGHPKYSDEVAELVNYSHISVIKKVLSGQEGVEINYNDVEKEERVAAYSPLEKYQWSAIVTEPVTSVFATRDYRLRTSLVINGSIIVGATAVAFILLSLLTTFISARNREAGFLESIGDGVVAIDNAGKIILFNTVASQLTHIPTDQALGKFYKKVFQITHSKDAHLAGDDFIQSALAGNKADMAKDSILTRPDGSTIALADSARPIISATGKTIGAIVVFRDATKERELERMKDEFVSITSHELRTPMTAISGFASLILEGDYGKVPTYLLEPLKDIEKSTDRLIALVNDLLNISRIESGRMKFALSDFLVSEIIDETLTSISPLAKQKGITMFKQKGSVRAAVQADKEKSKQVLINLLGNALKFTQRGTIAISVEDTDNVVNVSVHDSGIGIDKKDQDKLFGKFQQITTQEAGRPAGTGLGLYISRELARKMGGDLWLAASTLGKGSTFTFSLPTKNSQSVKRMKSLLQSSMLEKGV